MPARTASETGWLCSRRYPAHLRFRAGCAEHHHERLVTIVHVADWKRGLRRVIYPVYEARMLRRMPDNLPKHVGVMLDGNRRWARAVGGERPRPPGRARTRSRRCSAGATRSASRWSRCGCCRPTTSTGPSPSSGRCSDHRGGGRLAGRQRRWRLHPVGASTCCPRRPPRSSRTPRRPRATSTGCSSNRGRVRRPPRDRRRGPLAAQRARRRGTSIEELAEILDVEHIAEHLYTKGQPDPDLVIRTSGEQRLGGFLLWQSAK